MVKTLWYAQEGVVQVANAPVLAASLTATDKSLKNLVDALANTTSTPAVTVKNFTSRITDVSITGGDRDVEEVNTLGIGQFEKPGRPKMIQAEFTLVHEDTEGAQYIGGAPDSTSITGTRVIGGSTYTSTFTRYSFGEKTTAALDRQKLAMLFILDEGVAAAAGKVQYCLMNNATLVAREPISLTADGYVEEKWTVKCLAENYHEEDNFASSA